MQPNTEMGRKIRFALIPISWGVALAILYFLALILSKISGSSIKSLLQTDTLWPLAVFLPGFFFGKVLGLITANLISYSIPPIRRIFENEVSKTGRHNFSLAMAGLLKALIVLGVITAIGAFTFLRFK
jgi:hypothetical protein